ncbi:hypothetical protein FIBSPDRAFT_894426 [Athelia psychrophila]|uniref:Uncharacterized protein n=1 Tax=Athelia psychrophila TaxID=1759441 RepID=A0A166FTV2_9AGAM|nr:hypothetical protein FIBSPDRAFT_894426 [Fibularhizoctonia sp. CBS 109695]
MKRSGWTRQAGMKHVTVAGSEVEDENVYKRTSELGHMRRPHGIGGKLEKLEKRRQKRPAKKEYALSGREDTPKEHDMCLCPRGRAGVGEKDLQEGEGGTQPVLRDLGPFWGRGGRDVQVFGPVGSVGSGEYRRRVAVTVTVLDRLRRTLTQLRQRKQLNCKFYVYFESCHSRSGLPELCSEGVSETSDEGTGETSCEAGGSCAERSSGAKEAAAGVGAGAGVGEVGGDSLGVMRGAEGRLVVRGAATPRLLDLLELPPQDAVEPVFNLGRIGGRSASQSLGVRSNPICRWAKGTRREVRVEWDGYCCCANSKGKANEQVQYL